MDGIFTRYDSSLSRIVRDFSLWIIRVRPGQKGHLLNLLTACGIAFLAVFLLLSLLAGMMQLITRFFPERQSSIEPSLVAAITSAAAYHFPGARVTKIEEKS
jgi:hypothetical protein